MQQDFLRQSEAVTPFQIFTRSMSEQCCVFFCVIICELLAECRASDRRYKPDLSTLVKATHLKKGEGGWTKLGHDEQLEYLEKADVYTLFRVAKPSAEYLNDQVQAPKPKKRRTTTQDIRQMDDADLEAQLKWLQEEVQRRSTGTGAAPDDDRDA